jgi:death-on-curing protein
MADIIFLTLAEVIDIHTDQVERYGGSHGVRNMNLLSSAVAMPAASFGGNYLHADIFEMAAAYGFHIAQNHPFIDGNPAPWHPPAPAGGGERFLATGTTKSSRVSSSGRSRCLWEPPAPAGGGSTKRAALASALVFLEMNGSGISDASGRLYDAMIDIASGRGGKAAFADILRKLQR